ncbi:MAG: nucleotidyltransferase substrate binding protein [Desulfobacula sp.]|jgi:nucleotidyltransferase substrate binding protein (TIGR01987 family)|nr:nucleotidyltransferase substrate binding protein [Desulfobacula sp.]
MNQNDIRWKQRFENYKKALNQLREAVSLYNQKTLSNIECQGFIKAFEFTHELAWKVMKDYFQYQGNNLIMGSRDATRESFQTRMILDGEGWMDMIKARNSAVRTYEEAMVDEIILKIVNTYFDLFIDFEKVMDRLYNE